jgi:hypothetical protein
MTGGFAELSRESLSSIAESRLSLQVRFRDGRSRVFGACRGLPLAPAGGDAATRPGQLQLSSRDLSWVVEKLLIWVWLARNGPLTRAWLERTAGAATAVAR